MHIEMIDMAWLRYHCPQIYVLEVTKQNYFNKIYLNYNKLTTYPTCTRDQSIKCNHNTDNATMEFDPHPPTSVYTYLLIENI